MDSIILLNPNLAELIAAGAVALSLILDAFVMGQMRERKRLTGSFKNIIKENQ